MFYIINNNKKNMIIPNKKLVAARQDFEEKKTFDFLPSNVFFYIDYYIF